MPEVICTTVYQFPELSDAAKEKARSWYRELGPHDDWWDAVYEDFGRVCEILGIRLKTTPVRLMGGGTRAKSCIWFSGFWSQGDGACFEGSWKAASVKAEHVADGWGECEATTQIKSIAAEFAAFAKAWPESSFTVKHCGHYSHENCTDFSVSLGEDEDNGEGKSTPDQWEAAEKEITETAKDFMRWIYHQLEAAYEDYHADDNVAENIIANAYEFTADGKIY